MAVDRCNDRLAAFLHGGHTLLATKYELTEFFPSVGARRLHETTEFRQIQPGREALAFSPDDHYADFGIFIEFREALG